MYVKVEELIERLYQHEDDWAEGRTQNFSEVCMDCKLAADMISTLKASKHTQKRRRQRLSKKNKEKNKKIESLIVELEQLRREVE